MSIFEIGMLVCFGASWPFAVYKTWKTRSSKGKSLVFLWLVVIGYISGILHKIYYHYDQVVWLYAFNALLVSSDLALSYRYRIPRRSSADEAANAEVVS